LSSNGFDEAIGYSFIDAQNDGVFATVPTLVNENMTEPYVTLQDSVIEGAVRMRPTLLPGILDAVRLNLNHRRRDIKLFEIGKVFAAIGDAELPIERELLSIAVTGGELKEGRAMPTRQTDPYDIKGALEASLEALGISSERFTADEFKHLRKGQSTAVWVDGKKIGAVGRLNEEIAANYKFRQPVYVAEIDLQRLLEQPVEPVRYTPLPRFPSIVRDVSFTVTRDTSFDDVRLSIIERGVDLCRSVSFVDIFEGKGLGENERSLTIRIEYQSDERTLTEDEIEPIHRDIVRSVEAELKINQRI